MCKNNCGEPKFCGSFCNCEKSFSDSKNSFVSELNNSERDELETLRKEVKILKDLCLPEKFKSVWDYGYQSGIFTKGDLSIDLKNELYNEDKLSIMEDELESLRESDGD